MVFRRQALRFLAVTSLGATAGCSAELVSPGPNEQLPERLGTTWSPPDTEWRSPRADPRNTASVARSVRDPTPAWQNPHRSVDGATRRSSEVVGATEQFAVAATEYDDRVVLRCLNAADGVRRWRQVIPLGGERQHPRFGGIVDGQLILTDSATDVIAVRATDGAVQWRVNLHERVAESVPDRYLDEARRSPSRFSPVALATSDVIYAQTNYGVHGLSPADGTERWRLSLSDDTTTEQSLGIPSGIALTDRQVWASYSLPGSVYVVDIRQGQSK